MEHLTQQQQAILDSITNEFKAINIVKSSQAKFNYIDVSPILKMKRLIQEEKEVCQAMFKASLEAFMPLVEEKLKLLIDDLSIVEGLTFKITRNHQHIQLRIGNISVKCTAWGVPKTLSDGETKEAYAIEPNYYISYGDCGSWMFDTFEKLVASPRFKNEMERIINNIKN
jgi:hypothetical protein